MKKGTKIFLGIVAALLLLFGGAYLGYKMKVEPSIEKELEKVQEVLEDDEFKQKVDKIVFDFQNSGILTDESINDYLKSRGLSSSGQSQNSDLQGNTLAAHDIYSSQNAPTTDAPKKSTKLVDRVKDAMTADEFAFAMSVYNRLDIGYCTSNMNSDREAVKAYVRSVLSDAEISRALSIYSKYSYLLSN